MVLKSVFNKSKKANVWLDSFFVFLSVIIFGVVSILGFWVFSQINTDIQADAEMDAEAKDSMTIIQNGYPTWFDYGIGFVLLALWILSIILSLQIDSHPVFFIISVIVLMCTLFVVNSTMSAIDDLTGDAEIAPYTTSFPITMFIYQYIETIVALIGFTIAIALFSKQRAA